MDKVVETVKSDFCCFGTTFVFEPKEYSVHFGVHEICGLDGTEPDSPPVYEFYRWRDCGDMGPGLETACPQIRGEIKWDGCSHVWFGNAEEKGKDPDGYLHLCGESKWAWLAWATGYALTRCRDMLREAGTWMED